MATRNSPSEHANDYCMETMKGNDGKMYMSLPNKNMVCRWIKISDKIINTDELYYKAVERLGSKWDEFKRNKLDKKGGVAKKKTPSKSKSRKSTRKSRKSTRKSRKSTRKSRKTSRKSRKTSRKSSKTSRKSRKTSRKSRKTTRKV